MLPDYRIRFPSSKIDFYNEVFGGVLSGQQIDEYPEPGQARYDWMRMTIIGLLSNQSSYEEPINYKVGTMWFNLNDFFYKYYNGEKFDDIAHAIKIEDKSLFDWSKEIRSKFSDQAIFSGVADSTTNEIEIPFEALHSASFELNHPILYINGMIVDPRSTKFNSNRDKVIIENISLDAGNSFIVKIERMDIVVQTTVIAG